MYKELKLKERRKFYAPEFKPLLFSPQEASEYCKYVPQLAVDPRARLTPKFNMTFHTTLSQVDKSHSFPPVFYGRSTSSYPYIEMKGGREGEPICDQYRVVCSPPITILACADGCNWGHAPAEAAVIASKAFVDYIQKNRDLLRSTNRIAHLCLEGIAEAHNSIIAGDHPEGNLSEQRHFWVVWL